MRLLLECIVLSRYTNRTKAILCASLFQQLVLLYMGISKYLVNIAQPTRDKNETRLKNSESFVAKAKTWDISPTEVQVSFDVVNLYPCVPIKKATTVMIDLLNSDPELRERIKLTINDIKTLIELCLSKCYFLCDGKI